MKKTSKTEGKDIPQNTLSNNPKNGERASVFPCCEDCNRYLIIMY
jgi:hypothetical protein